jgi:dipeptidyl aminopeptidase/acylaminoacyl peptidase
VRRAGLRAGRLLAIPASIIVLLAFAEPAATRPYTVEDLVHQESFGQVAFDPTGRWLAYERRVARADAPTFPTENRHEVFENRLRVVDMTRRATARALIVGDPIGISLGPFSPDGRRVAFYGLRRGRWQLGVVTLSTRHLRWLDVDPEFPFWGRTVQWRNATQLVAIARPRGILPLVMKFNRAGPRELPARWSATLHGDPSVQAIGAGRYFSKRPRKAPNRLVLVDAVSGRVTGLATGEIEDVEVSPDGGHVAFAEAGEDVRLVADQPVQGPNGTAWHHESLGIADLNRHRVIHPCPGADVSGELLSWSPSGKRLLVLVRSQGAPLSAGRVVAVSAEGSVEDLPLGSAQPVLYERPESARAVWLGEVPAVLARHDGRQDWIAIDHGAPIVLTAQLSTVPDSLQPVPGGAIGAVQGSAWRLTPSGLAAIRTPDGARAVSGGRVWERRLTSNPPSVAPELAVQSVAHGEARALSVGSGTPSPSVALPDGTARVVAFSPRGQAFAAISEDTHGVARLRFWSGAGWTLVDTVDRAQQDVDLLQAVPTHQPSWGPDGRAQLAWLYLPASSPRDGPPPVVVVPYPGQRHTAPATLADYGRSFMTPSIPILVGAGYAVLVPSLPLPDGAEPAAGLGGRILGIIDAAAAQHPGAFDPQRLALWGHSFGGYGTVAIIAQTNRFRAAIDMAGPIDLVSMWGTFEGPARVDASEGTMISGEMGWTEDFQGAMHAPPWRDPSRYVRNSPIFQADRIHTPLLILEGDQDPIPMMQGEEIFSALYRQDRDAVLATYWGEGHILYSPGNVRDAYRRGLAWLKDNLARPVSLGAGNGQSLEPASANTAPSSR